MGARNTIVDERLPATPEHGVGPMSTDKRELVAFLADFRDVKREFMKFPSEGHHMRRGAWVLLTVILQSAWNRARRDHRELLLSVSMAEESGVLLRRTFDAFLTCRYVDDPQIVLDRCYQVLCEVEAVVNST